MEENNGLLKNKRKPSWKLQHGRFYFSDTTIKSCFCFQLIDNQDVNNFRKNIISVL